METDTGHCFGDCFHGFVIAPFVRAPDLRCDLFAILPADGLCHAGKVGDIGSGDDSEQQFDEDVGSAAGEVQIDFLRSRFVTLGRTTRSGPGPSVLATVRDPQVSVACELVEMVSSHVGMDAEQPGDIAARHGVP